MRVLDSIKSFFSRTEPEPVENKTISIPLNYYYPDYGYGTGGDGSKYPAGIINSGSVLQFDHQTIRLNSRQMEFKSVHMRAIINRFVGTVIGRGLFARCEPKFKILGITPEEADAWADDVNLRYDLYCRDKKSVANETNNVYQESKLIYRCAKRDGEMFVRFLYDGPMDAQNRLQIQTIDPGQINGNGYTNTDGMQYTYDDGIVRNEKGKEIAYIVTMTMPDGTVKPITIPAKGKRSGRTMMIHGFSPEYPGMGRGLSAFLGTIQNFQDLNAYESATLQKAKNQASDAYAIENQIQAPNNPREGEQTNFPAGIYGSQQTDTGGQTQVTSPEGGTFCPVPELTNQQPGSTMITNLNRGSTMKSIKQTAPADKYSEYVNFSLENNSSANSMPGSIAKMRFQDSFSAQKGETLLFWNTVVAPEIDEFVSDFSDPHREAWLSEEIAAGRIQAPGWSDPVKRKAWLSCRWQGVVMPDDISKTMSAIIEAAKYNITALSDEARKYNGSDIKSNAAKNARDFSEISPDPHDGVNKINNGEENDQQ